LQEAFDWLIDWLIHRLIDSRNSHSCASQWIWLLTIDELFMNHCLVSVCFLSEVSSSSSLSDMIFFSIPVFDGCILKKISLWNHIFPTGKSEALYLLWKVDQEAARELWMLACNDWPLGHDYILSFKTF
jgi:hypothetical protein